MFLIWITSDYETATSLFKSNRMFGPEVLREKMKFAQASSFMQESLLSVQSLSMQDH